MGVAAALTALQSAVVLPRVVVAAGLVMAAKEVTQPGAAPPRLDPTVGVAPNAARVLLIAAAKEGAQTAATPPRLVPAVGVARIAARVVIVAAARGAAHPMPTTGPVVRSRSPTR